MKTLHNYYKSVESCCLKELNCILDNKKHEVVNNTAEYSFSEMKMTLLSLIATFTSYFFGSCLGPLLASEVICVRDGCSSGSIQS